MKQNKQCNQTIIHVYRWSYRISNYWYAEHNFNTFGKSWLKSVKRFFSQYNEREFPYSMMNMIYCTCLCYWNPCLTAVGGLEVVEVTVMCPFFWTGALCASQLHSQCPHMCCWCIHLQRYTMTRWGTCLHYGTSVRESAETHVMQRMMIIVLSLGVSL